MTTIDEHRGNAYRHLLYMATLDIRNLCQSRGEVTWRPTEWRRAYMRSRRAGALADWLHNLASFAARDFRGFDEVQFWAEHAHMLRRFPGHPFDDYERHFHSALAGKPGHWGGGVSSAPD